MIISRDLGFPIATEKRSQTQTFSFKEVPSIHVKCNLTLIVALQPVPSMLFICKLELSQV